MSRLFPLLLALAAASADAGLAAEITIDSPMESDPAITLPGSYKTLPPSFKALWFEALAGPDVELKLRAAETIARARDRGLDEMGDAAPHLSKVLADPTLRLPVRLAVARALIAVDSRGSAADLFEQAGRGELEMRQLVEPALAEWDFAPARAEWLRRLNDPAAPHQLKVLAVRCLGTVREPAASQRLLQLAVSADSAAGLRLEAARAVAEIELQGLDDAAGRLADDESAHGTVDRLVAASLLKRHRSEQAISLLKALALDPEPAVAAPALQWLLDADPALVVPFADRVVRSQDANVRRLGVRALVAVPSPAAISTLGPLMDDPHPEVRAEVRDSLFGLAARPELAGPVRDAGTRELNREGWRGLEQASMLLGALDHEPAADRLLALLEHPRPEVIVSAAWALRRMALMETLPAMFALAETRTRELRAGRGREGVDGQLAQIFQAFGQMAYRPADALLREYVPKTPALGLFARAGAIWALGHLHAGTPDERLVPELEARLQDVASIPSESGEVRRQAAAALGRMSADQALPTLRLFAEPDGAQTFVGGACNWAVTQLTGEAFPEGGIRRESEADWFLVPL